LFAGASWRRWAGRRRFGDLCARRAAADGARDRQRRVAFIVAYAYTQRPHDRPNVRWPCSAAFGWRGGRDRAPWLIAYSLVMARGSAFRPWSALGFFYYRHPDLAGVPRWLQDLSARRAGGGALGASCSADE
jgi:hypothetical protein